MEQSEFLGRKIFFLYPQSVIQDNMLDVLIMSGFEPYVCRNPERAQRLLERFPGSIMFINIDEGMPETKWEGYIREIQKNPKTQDSRLGILSYNNDEALMQKYLMDIAVPCGYIRLKLGLTASTRIILRALEANEARGRRKCIRACCEDDMATTTNYKTPEGTLYYGKLLDISSMGFVARFDQPMEFKINTRIQKIQLRLRGSIIMADGIVAGKRSDTNSVWLILLDPNMNSYEKLTIFRYIKSRLQLYIDQISV